jgi:hypothetical protein
MQPEERLLRLPDGGLVPTRGRGGELSAYALDIPADGGLSRLKDTTVDLRAADGHC